MSTAGGAQARWRRDGKELFYVAPDARPVAAPIELAPTVEAVKIGTPVPLFATHVGFLEKRQQYVVSPDGQRLLIAAFVEREEVASPISLILNWKGGSSRLLDWRVDGDQNQLRYMGRVRQLIHVDGKTFWTLFDTGARNTYVTPVVAQVLKTSLTPRPIRTALGGAVRETNTAALLEAEIQGRPISTHALVIDEIGKDEEGAAIEILFGALAMQQWGIRPIPDEERLDLSHYPEEFVEF